MDLSDTNFDPYEQLLTLTHQYEQLVYHNQKIIAVVNQQTEIIQAQAVFIEQFQKRLDFMEEIINRELL